MSGVHNQVYVRTLKEHRCGYCGCTIPKGVVALNEHGIYDHAPYNRYACGECEPYLDGFWRWCNGECDNPLNESFAYYRELYGEVER